MCIVHSWPVRQCNWDVCLRAVPGWQLLQVHNSLHIMPVVQCRHVLLCTCVQRVHTMQRWKVCCTERVVHMHPVPAWHIHQPDAGYRLPGVRKWILLCTRQPVVHQVPTLHILRHSSDTQQQLVRGMCAGQVFVKCWADSLPFVSAGHILQLYCMCGLPFWILLQHDTCFQQCNVPCMQQGVLFQGWQLCVHQLQRRGIF